MLTENKFSKYLLYAIGEIVLVVIGILIALQINTWNQERANKKLSIEYHQKMADELEAFEKRFEDDSKRAEEIVQYLIKTVAILKKGELTITSRDTLNFTLENYYQFVRFQGELKTFEEMESTGNLGLLYNKQLKSNILDYITLLETISEIYDNLGDDVSDTKLVDKYVTVFLDVDGSNLRFEYDFQDLANDQFLINRLARFSYWWKTKQEFSKRLSASSKTLKKSILKEINKNKLPLKR